MKLAKRIIKKILLTALPLLPRKLMVPVSDIPQIVTSETETERNPTVLEDKMPKCKCSFEYKGKPTYEWRKATVNSRAGKSTGKNKFWLNVKYKEDGSLRSLNFEELSE